MPGLTTRHFLHFGTTFYLIRVGSCPWIPHSVLCAKHLINICEPHSSFRIQQTLKSTHKVWQLIKSLRVQQTLKLTTLLFVQSWSLCLFQLFVECVTLALPGSSSPETDMFVQVWLSRQQNRKIILFPTRLITSVKFNIHVFLFYSQQNLIDPEHFHYCGKC